ncbi:unnamed protein product [Cyprideis torosa]|uniref:tRNA (guanine(9)-N(1))-methyltransferase n=1 Tax=Cyprideis torosa TaxID=163714 RepID=A0A7R8ZN47_9CRUS|nr:unnamed protein product [Cyprideis torosa]CAG0887046.1 unnamed protein product [Cyprideis torosa]
MESEQLLQEEGTKEAIEDDEEKKRIQCDVQKNGSLSKRQLKRKTKEERFRREVLPVKRQKEKEQRKAKREELRSRGQLRPPAKKTSMAESKNRTSVVIDLGFDELMGDKDIRKLVKQVHRCYSLNRRSPVPFQLFLTSIGGQALNRLSINQGYQNWDMHIHKEPYEEVFVAKKQQIVYLSSEAEEDIRELHPDEIYVIGGLVDHNQHKGLTHRLATEKGIRTAKLPISQFLDLKTRHVLTVCQGGELRNFILIAPTLHIIVGMKDMYVNVLFSVFHILLLFAEEQLRSDCPPPSQPSKASPDSRQSFSSDLQGVTTSCADNISLPSCSSDPPCTSYSQKLSGGAPVESGATSLPLEPSDKAATSTPLLPENITSSDPIASERLPVMERHSSKTLSTGSEIISTLEPEPSGNFSDVTSAEGDVPSVSTFTPNQAWRKAFLTAIPPRKGAVPRTNDSDTDQ